MLSVFLELPTLIDEVGVACAAGIDRFIGIDMDIGELTGWFMSRFFGIDIIIDEVAGCSISLFDGMDIGVMSGFCIP